jgi:hypothetical protein
MLVIPHGDNVGMDVCFHLAAGAANATGAASVRFTFQCRGGIAGQLQPVSAARQQQRMGQGSPGRSFPDPQSGRFLQIKQCHHDTSFRWMLDCITTFGKKEYIGGVLP